jgi:hypothetical protein
MSFLTRDVVSPRFHVDHHEVYWLANSFFQEAHVAGGVLTDPDTIMFEEYTEFGLLLARDVLAPDYSKKCRDIVLACAELSEYILDRDFHGVMRHQGRKFNDELDILAEAVLSFADNDSKRRAQIGVNTYFPHSPKGKSHTDLWSQTPVLLLGLNPGGIEVVDCVLDEKDFETASAAGRTALIEFGNSDIVFYDGYTHRGYGTDPSNPRQTVIAWLPKP